MKQTLDSTNYKLAHAQQEVLDTKKKNMELEEQIRLLKMKLECQEHQAVLAQKVSNLVTCVIALMGVNGAELVNWLLNVNSCTL